MRRLPALCLAAAWPLATLAAPDDVEVLSYEAVQDYVASGAADGDAKTVSSPRVNLSFIALGRKFELDLERNVRLDGVRAGMHLPAGVGAYRGTLAGRPGSWVRIVTGRSGPTGLIWDGSALYGLEAPLDTAARNVSSGGSILFRLADVYVAPAALACGATTTARSGAVLLDRLAAEMTALEQQGAVLNLDIGAVADFEFHQIFGSSSESAVLARLNNVDGIFSEQLGVQLSVAEVAVFTTSADPFTETDAEGLLEELAVYRGATPAQDAQGLTHLFTGRNLDGSTAGIAYVGTLCSTRAPFDPLQRSFAAGLSEGTRGAVIDSLIAAHEIGHGFGAPHDAEAGSACEATPANFLMAPSVNGTDQFSQCSIAEMQAEIEAASCLTPIGAPDLVLDVAATSASVLVGARFDHIFHVANVGAATAGSARLTVSYESGLTLAATEASAGACTAAGQSVTCELGDIAGGAVHSVRLTLHAANVGTHTIDAAAFSADDAMPANNDVSRTVTVAPAVDLVLSASAGVLQSQQQATLPVTLNNAADFGANAVLVAVTLTSGLRPDTATLAGAACAITGQTLSCPAPSLAARASAALLLTVTAVTAGSQQVSLGASSAEAELAPADNSLVIAVSVAEPSGAAGETGGGGAVGWLCLLAIGVLAAGRCRKKA